MVYDMSKSKSGITTNKDGATLGFKSTLGAAAVKLCNNLGTANCYYTVLGLIFLKYISDAFKEERSQLLKEVAQGSDLEDPDKHHSSRILIDRAFLLDLCMNEGTFYAKPWRPWPTLTWEKRKKFCCQPVRSLSSINKLARSAQAKELILAKHQFFHKLEFVMAAINRVLDIPCGDLSGGSLRSFFNFHLWERDTHSHRGIMLDELGHLPASSSPSALGISADEG
jgi:type I restriction-modification system DNA methylase subunit